MSARLVYVMDPMCSWCWGFAPVLEALAGQAQAVGVELHLVVGGLRREHDKLDARSRERILGYWRQVQEATGQRFDFEGGLPGGLVYDTEAACRALVTARHLAPQKVLPLVQAIGRAFYLEGQDVTQPAALLALAAAVGLDADEFAAHFDSPAMRQATQADFDWSGNLGIAGFPTLLAERAGQLCLLTNGYAPAERLSPLLARWLAQGAHG